MSITPDTIANAILQELRATTPNHILRRLKQFPTPVIAVAEDNQPGIKLIIIFGTDHAITSYHKQRHTHYYADPTFHQQLIDAIQHAKHNI